MQLDVIRGGLGTQQSWCPDPASTQEGRTGDLIAADRNFRPLENHDGGRSLCLHRIDERQPPRLLPRRRSNRIRDTAGSATAQRIIRRATCGHGSWAEQLGLAPDMGEALLADPMAGFELVQAVALSGKPVHSAYGIGAANADTERPARVDGHSAYVGQGSAAIRRGDYAGGRSATDIFNTLSDPTTTHRSKPAARAGLP